MPWRVRLNDLLGLAAAAYGFVAALKVKEPPQHLFGQPSLRLLLIGSRTTSLHKERTEILLPKFRKTRLSLHAPCAAKPTKFCGSVERLTTFLGFRRFGARKQFFGCLQRRFEVANHSLQLFSILR